MVASSPPNIWTWIVRHVLWDSSGIQRAGSFGVFWALRKVLLCAAFATVLTWVEWIEHHPPEIVIIAVLHFLLVLATLAILIFAMRWFGRAIRSR